jgi:hypothetical protein
MPLLIPGEAAASRLLRTNGLASWELPRDGLLASYAFVQMFVNFPALYLIRFVQLTGQQSIKFLLSVVYYVFLNSFTKLQ